MTQDPEISSAAKQGSILIVDDDASLRHALHKTLEVLGFNASEACSGEEALALARAISYDVVLLDINMPGIDGLETCRQLRRLSSSIGILMLTVRDSEEDKVGGFEAGADDYVTKPFHIRELTARVRAVLRRALKSPGSTDDPIRIGHIMLDPARREVLKSDAFVHVTPKEFELLHYLMAHAGLPITHGRLLHAVWGPDYGGEVEYLRTFISQLRKKIEDDPANPEYLLTDIQVGYRFWDGDSHSRRGPNRRAAQG